MIFYFTATGNSLAVARELGDDLRSIPQELARPGELSYQDDTIGIVCPTYGALMPRIVRRFLARASFSCDYLFVVMTYGIGCGVAEREAVAFAESVGVRVDFAATVSMADNYLPAFDMADQAATVPDKDVPGQIEALKCRITTRERGFRAPTAHQEGNFVRMAMAYYRHPETDDGSRIHVLPERCVGCGRCARVCPVGNFFVGAGRVAERHTPTCEFCLACAHACPARAITISGGEPNPDARYRNPGVTLSDIIHANRIHA